eukprot:15094724-Alexandrium_andersonii.AAC.1
MSHSCNTPGSASSQPGLVNVRASPECVVAKNAFQRMSLCMHDHRFALAQVSRSAAKAQRWAWLRQLTQCFRSSALLPQVHLGCIPVA